MEAYWASKALSRSTVQEFVKKHNPHFDYVALLPSVVIGPDPRATSSKDILEGTRAMVLGPILGNISLYPMVGVPIHVSDVAKAHVTALQPSVPGNAEYILSSDCPEGVEWNAALSIAKVHFPEDCGYVAASPSFLSPLGGNFPATSFYPQYAAS